ncbi:hypothetical protein Tco_1264600 [Tanacetum coccineum]
MLTTRNPIKLGDPMQQKSIDFFSICSWQFSYCNTGNVGHLLRKRCVSLQGNNVEGLGHNLFSIGQFCDADLKVAFRKNTCFIRNLEGVDLLSGFRDTYLYTISLDDMLKSSPICLLSKASKTMSWLWHR